MGTQSAILFVMLARALSLLLVLGLVTLGPTPLSACAIFTDLPGDCAPPYQQSDCERMGMVQPPVELKAPSDLSCCQLNQAPPPEAPGKVSPPEASAQILCAGHLVVLPRSAQFPSSEASLFASPPDLQQLLCVFLI